MIYDLPFYRANFKRGPVAGLGVELPTYPKAADLAATIGPIVLSR